MMRGGTHSARRAVIVLGAAAALAAGAAPANAAVTLGQLSPITPVSACVPSVDFVPAMVAEGNTYTAPGKGTINSWSTTAKPGAGQQMGLKVYNRIADPDVFRVVGSTSAQPLPAAGGLATFPASIQVGMGDRIGVFVPPMVANPGCAFMAAPSDLIRAATPNVSDGGTGNYTITEPGSRLNVTAVFVPSNTVTVGKISTSKRKGTATVELDLPNPGELTTTGPGVKAGIGAGSAAQVLAGKTLVTISATGKKKKKLKTKGKVKLAPVITYTPTGGDAPSTQTLKVSLKKKKPRKRR